MQASPSRERNQSCNRDRRRTASGVRSARAAQTVTSALAAIRRANENDALLGKLLAQIERDRSYVDEGCSSADHWAQMHGLDRGRATSLLRAGRSFAVAPDTERAVLDGKITPQVAGIIGDVVPPEPLLPPKHGKQPTAAEDAARQAEIAARTQAMFERAMATSKSKLVREVREEKERVKQGERVVPLSFLVKERVRDDWRLARKIACRKAGKALSEGEAFEFVTGDFLGNHDKDGLSGRKKPRERRMGPTSERPDDRTIAAEVRRRVIARAGGHCEFPGCPHGTFLELCHIKPHSEGGDREEDNLVLLCTAHHTMFDKGRIAFFERIAGTDSRAGGVAFVITATGVIVEPDPALSNADPLPQARGDRGGNAGEPTPAADAGGLSATPLSAAVSGEAGSGEAGPREMGPGETSAASAGGVAAGGDGPSCGAGGSRGHRDARSRDGPVRGGDNRAWDNRGGGESPFRDQVSETVPVRAGAGPP